MNPKEEKISSLESKIKKDKRAIVEKILSGSTFDKNTGAYKSAYKMLVNSSWEGLSALHLIILTKD